MSTGTCHRCGATGPLGATTPDRILPLINECALCAWRNSKEDNPDLQLPSRTA